MRLLSVALILVGFGSREPILNPAHCPDLDGYLSDSTQPGYNTY